MKVNKKENIYNNHFVKKAASLLCHCDSKKDLMIEKRIQNHFDIKDHHTKTTEKYENCTCIG